MTKVPMA